MERERMKGRKEGMMIPMLLELFGGLDWIDLDDGFDSWMD